MSIKVRYFASLADLVGRPEGTLEFAQPMTVRSVWVQDTGNKAIPENLLVAINLDYAALEDEVKDGDEVAFFPPVTGG